MSAGKHLGHEDEMCSLWNPALMGDMGTKWRLGDSENGEHTVEMPTLRKRLIHAMATELVCMLLGAICVPPHTTHRWVFSTFIFCESLVGMSECQSNSPWELNLALQLLPRYSSYRQENFQHGRCPITRVFLMCVGNGRARNFESNVQPVCMAIWCQGSYISQTCLLRIVDGVTLWEVTVASGFLMCSLGG